MSRSIHLQPRAPEVVFNRALVLERMMLKDRAILEWEAYLKLDGSSEWANEARKHLAELKAVMKAREEALALIVDDPEKFLELANSGRADAEAFLREIAVTKWLPRVNSDVRRREAATRLAQILKEKHGDSWLRTCCTETRRRASTSSQPDGSETRPRSPTQRSHPQTKPSASSSALETKPQRDSRGRDCGIHTRAQRDGESSFVRSNRQMLKISAANRSDRPRSPVFSEWTSDTGLSSRAISVLPAIQLSSKGVESALHRLTRMVKEQISYPDSR